MPEVSQTFAERLIPSALEVKRRNGDEIKPGRVLVAQ